jgi:hypothetical protein
MTACRTGRDNIQATLADAIGVACAAGRMTDALCRR